MTKRYCSHCGTPNPASNQICLKCDKPISSALRVLEKREEPYHKKQSKARFSRQSSEDGEEFYGEIVMPSVNDVIVHKAQKLTIGALKNGAEIPSFDSPTDVEVTSRAKFYQPDLG